MLRPLLQLQRAVAAAHAPTVIGRSARPVSAGRIAELAPRDSGTMCLKEGDIPHPLTASGKADTLAGGTVGHIQERSSSAPSASSATTDAVQLSTCLDALTGMYAGYITLNRKLLDDSFEKLVEAIEVMRDAVPKA